MKYFLGVFLLAPFISFSFDMEKLSSLDSLTVHEYGKGPLVLDGNEIRFKNKYSLGSFDKSESKVENRYFYYSPAQRSNGTVVSYRFPETTPLKEIKHGQPALKQVSFFQNEWQSLKFRSMTFSSDSKSLESLQECWQVDIKKPEVQCVIVNLTICERIRKINYDWDKEYRRDAQAYRQQMKDTFNSEVIPEDLKERYSLGFKNYQVLDDYDHSSTFLNSLGSVPKIRVQKACMDFWPEVFSPEELKKLKAEHQTP